MLTPEEQQVLSVLRTEYNSASLNPHDFLPPMLFHYTSARGLLGIIETGVLRASNFSYLNDASEFRYGESLVHDLLASKLVGAASPPVRALIEATEKELGRLASILELYLICFCAAPDLLSQWRGYGSATGRFCIGFDTENLSAAYLKYSLDRVIYDRLHQEEIAGRVIDHATEAVTRADALGNKSLGAPLIRGILELLTERLVRTLCFFKHPGFAEEKEWRAVHQLQEISNIRFDAAGGVIKPYVELIVGSGEPPRLPISEVIVGASTFGAQSRKSVEMLLRRYGYDRVELKESAVPFRDA